MACLHVVSRPQKTRRSAYGPSLTLLLGVTAAALLASGAASAEAGGLRIGWAQTDITPDEPVVLSGQFHARVMEDIRDPITATALALESESGEGVIMVSCDLVGITDEFRGGSDVRGRVRAMVSEALPGDEQPMVVLNATHTHASADTRIAPELAEKLGVDICEGWSRWGVELDAMSPLEYVEFAVPRIAEAAVQAWEAREPGGISFGLGHAVVGHNRIMAYDDGRSQMYGSTNRPDFSHVEGWEDHAVHLIFTWAEDAELTGVIINLASPSQHDEGIYELSADFWHETREELRARLGEDLYVLPQCSAAGDQSERVMIHRRAESRMEEITGENRRDRIAQRIADAVTSVLPYMDEHIDWNPVFAQRMETFDLQRRFMSEQDYEEAQAAFEGYKQNYEDMRAALDEQPEMREEHRWYLDITRAYRRMAREALVMERIELEQEEPTVPIEVYVMRLGDIALATNPFELYLDFGVRMQERSPAIQTFLVQLAGSGTYVAPERSVEGGAYGAVPGSNVVGAEGGQQLVERTLEVIEELWNEE